MELISVLVIAAFLGLIPASIAKNKGYSFGVWWFYGWMLFIVAIIHVSVIPDRKSEALNKGTESGQRYDSTSMGTMQSNPQQYTPPTGRTQQPTIVYSAADEILKYKKLLDQGILTEEEFNQKKKQLLGL